MAHTISIPKDIWDDTTFRDAPFSEREALIWLTAKGRIVRATVTDLSKAWHCSTRRTAHIIKRLARIEAISVHGTGAARSIFVGLKAGQPCGLFSTVNGQRYGISGSGLWRGGALPAAIRAAVLKRDGEACRYCGSDQGPFDIDHVKPVALGGSDRVENLVVACTTCNRSKGAKTLEQWRGVAQ